MSPDEICKLPPVVDVTTAGRVLGVGRGAAYALVRAGKWPTPVVRLGRLIKVPTAPLLALLGQPVQVVAGASSTSARDADPSQGSQE